MTKATLIANYHCVCGENPYWDAKRKCIFWTDIPPGKLYIYYPETGEHKEIYSGQPVGGFTLQENGDLLLFQVNQVSSFNLETGELKLLKDNIDEAMERFNDVIADPAGRVFAGTIGTNNETGGLYRVDIDGSITRLFQGSGCANGMGFSPDLKTFYWTCSTTRRIFSFSYDKATGELSERKILIEMPAGEGVPDGLAIDAKGNLWSARWDGFGIYKYTVEGEQFDKISLPVAKTSSLVFAGNDLSEIYISTAGGNSQSETLDGALFMMPVPDTGLPEFQSNIEF